MLFPISSSSAASPYDVKMSHSSNVHAKGADFNLKTSKRKETSGKKSGNEIMKHRFVFQTRSQMDILDDGYRWRKYGEKTVKNNKFPRFVLSID